MRVRNQEESSSLFKAKLPAMVEWSSRGWKAINITIICLSSDLSLSIRKDQATPRQGLLEASIIPLIIIIIYNFGMECLEFWDPCGVKGNCSPAVFRGDLGMRWFCAVCRWENSLLRGEGERRRWFWFIRLLGCLYMLCWWHAHLHGIITYRERHDHCQLDWDLLLFLFKSLVRGCKRYGESCNPYT